MPIGKGRGLHQINAPLSNLSVRYANDSNAFIAEKIATPIQVKKESDAYYVFGSDHFRIPETLRANGASANQAEYSLSTSSYNLERHSLRDIVTDRDRDNSDEGLKPDIDATENLTHRILLRKELQAKTALFTTTSFTNNHSLTSTLAWTALTTLSDPIGDIATATSAILKNSGVRPNTLVMGFTVFNDGLAQHPNILERIKYSERGVITEEIISAVLGVQKINVGTAVRDTSLEGITASKGFVWDLDAFLGYISPSPSLKSPSAFYNFIKGGKGEYPYAVKKYRDEEREGDWIEVNSFYASKAVGSSAGYLIRGVNT